KHFSKITRNTMLYLMFANRVVDLKKSDSREKALKKTELFEIYREFNRVFSKREASILLSHEDEHKIDFQDDEQSSHRSLYSIFTKKLNELRRYLENKQQKD